MRVTGPSRDAGNATLTIENNMWSFSPKVNRVIKMPSSMMSQSWMGSDFSNNDVTKSDDIIDEYEHTLIETVQQDGHYVYVIESIPNEDAAVVLGSRGPTNPRRPRCTGARLLRPGQHTYQIT